MPLDTLITIRRTFDPGGGTPATVTHHRMWADRFNEVADRDIISTGQSTFRLERTTRADFRVRWQRFLVTPPGELSGELAVIDEYGAVWNVDGITQADRRRSFVTLNCSRVTYE